MSKLLLAGALALGLTLPALPALAAEGHPYALGTVWEMSYIEVKPGHFEDYMKYLSTTWAKIQESEKAAGRVVSYKVLSISSPRDGEPDLILMIEHPNFAAFDTPLDVQDASMKAVFGSLTKADQAGIAREDIRSLRGGLDARELTLVPGN